MAIRFAPDAPKVEPKRVAEPAAVKPKRKRAPGAGRPVKPNKLEPITLRLPPDVIARYKAGGDDWRARMADALAKAVE